MVLTLRGRRSALGILALVCVAAAACVDGNSALEAAAKLPAISAPSVLQFAQDGTLEVTPGARVTITLTGPRGEGAARVWLDGQYGNASLDRGSVELGEGTGSVTLSAPTSPAVFSIRARLGAASARLEVSVSATGFTEVRVLPKYHGPRKSTSVVASAFLGRSCVELTQGPVPEDGALRAEGPVGGALVLSSVPAFNAVSILARIERYAFACVELDPLAKAPAIELELYDRPLAIERTFAIELKVEADQTELSAWTEMVGPVASEWVSAFVAPLAVENAWLLDAMTESATAISSNAGTQFQAARTGGAWDGKTATWLAAHLPSIRARAAAYAAAGTALPPTPLLVDLGPGAAGQAQITPAKLASRSLASGWIAAPAPFDWKADPADLLSLSGAMSIRPGALLGLGADVGATKAGAPDFPTGIATGIDCVGLGVALVGAGVSYAGCDATCTGQLCRRAIGDRERAASAAVDSTYPPLSLGITASATPDVGPDADVRSFAGTWTGAVQGVPAPFGLHGMISGRPAP